jgi:hypothetical protein
MGKRRLKQILETKTGEEDLILNIPHPVLPPRLQEKSQNRNLLLILDTDFQIRARWEGTKRGERMAFTPKAASHLLKEVRRNMQAFSQDLFVFGNFVRANGEHPIDGSKLDDPSSAREPKQAERHEIIVLYDSEEGKKAEPSPKNHRVKEVGGESPLPFFDW